MLHLMALLLLVGLRYVPQVLRSVGLDEARHCQFYLFRLVLEPALFLGSGTTTTGGTILINGLANGILILENAGLSTGLYGFGTSMEGLGNGFKVIVTTVSGGSGTYGYGLQIPGSNYILQLQGITQGMTGYGSLGVINIGVLNTIINNGIIKGSDTNSSSNAGVWDWGMCAFTNNGIIQASTFSRGFQSAFTMVVHPLQHLRNQRLYSTQVVL